MTYLVTAATGQLGRLALDALLDRGVAPGDVVATARDTAALADLAERGIQVRRADYDDAGSLRTAFAGVDRLLLVSSPTVGARVPQHRNAVEAAREAGVGLVAYTSIAKADTSSVPLATEHLETERLLAASGVPFALLRNGWYLENYTDQLSRFLEHGAILGSAGDGVVSAATRADLAEAAAAVLVAEDPAGGVFELGGDQGFTLTELAAEVSRASGSTVLYRDLPVGEYAAALVAAGLPAAYAEVLAASDAGLARGDLHVTSGDLARLIDRRPTSMSEAVAAAAAVLTAPA